MGSTPIRSTRVRCLIFLKGRTMNLKCFVTLNKNWKTPLEAILLTFVPSPSRSRTMVTGDVLDTISTDAIVQLLTFDSGKLYQVPLECVQVVDSFASGDDAVKPSWEQIKS